MERNPEFINSHCSNIASYKKAFFDFLVSQSEEIIFAAEEQNNFDWRHLKKLYNDNKNILSASLDYMRVFCDFAFSLFRIFKCEDYQLVIKIILMHKKAMALLSNLDPCKNCSGQYDDIPKHYVGEEIVSEAVSIVKEIPKLKVDDSCLFANQEFYGLEAATSVDAGEYVYLQFLVKYGLTYNIGDALGQLRAQLEKLFRRYVLYSPMAERVLLESVLNRMFEYDYIQPSNESL